MSKYYEGVIYLTKCTHRRYPHLRYVGLDTKGPEGEPSYLGSSTALKWWMQYLGRQHFEKEILEKVKGTMIELCRIEQEYIEEFDAVNDKNFFNMNGQRQARLPQENVIDMNFCIRPSRPAAHELVGGYLSGLQMKYGGLYRKQRDLISAVLSMALYGYLKYDQEEFGYDVYTTYYSCQADEVQRVLGMMVSAQLIDLKGGMICVTDNLIDNIPEELMHEHFHCKIG